jgi:DNA-binding GntR family transcriptional regulator
MTAVDPASDALASLSRARHVIARTTTAERVADAVRDEVAEGRLRPCDRLPEKALGEALGVSRNTVREALSQLVVERVLVREHNRGVFVAEPDREIVRDVYRARRVLEPTAALHGEAFTVAGVAAIRAAVTEGKAAAVENRWDDVGSANQHFHRAVVALAGSTRLDQQMALLLAEMRLVFHRMPDVREFFEPYVERNDVIAGMLESGDRAAAAAELTAYLHASEKQLLAAYDAS